MYFLNRCRTSTSDVLRYRRITLPHDERQGRTLSRLPAVQGPATAFGVHGYSGTQGRYIYWAAGVAGGAIVGFIIAYCLVGFVAGLVVLVAVVSTGIALIMLKQRKGLHTKKDGRGVYIYAHSKKL